MKTMTAKHLLATMLGIALFGSASAQQTDFPATDVAPRSCNDFKWDADMQRDHPRVIDACQEVVTAEGGHWARFTAKFVRVVDDGGVVFNVHDQRGRMIEEVTIQPFPGQVAYVNDREVPFNRLSTNDSFNLYAPEGRYGFATRAGVPQEQVARVTVARTPAATPTPPPMREEVMMAQNEPRTLPQTAGPLPLVALGGMFSLLAGLGLTIRRKR